MAKRLLLALSVLTACQPPGFKADGSPEFFEAEKEMIFSLSPLQPPPENPTNKYAEHPAAARLGQYLFFDSRLSGNGALSCASCHQPALGWTDGQALAVGLGRQIRNSPSLWNVSQQRWFFHDGRADTLWAQALQPLENPLEMGGSRSAVYLLFQRDPQLRRAYQAIFGPLPRLGRQPAGQARPVPEQPQSAAHQAWMQLLPADQTQINRFASNLGKAIEAFERRLNSSETPFDRFARGLRDNQPELQKSLSKDAQLGLRLFIGRGQCILCHSGPGLSDGEFHNLGLPALANLAVDQGRYQGISRLLSDPFNGKGPYSDLPAGDAWADKLNYLERQQSNQGEFKTPSLRELAQTAPYMHDGRFRTLEEVIAFYNTPDAHQPALGRREDTIQPLKLSADEIRQLSAFLRSLSSGPPSAELSSQPKLY